MASQAGLAEYCAELFERLGTVRTKRMFGGYGIYVDDVFIAIIAQDTLYLKADEQTRPRFEAAGSRRFEYSRQGEQRGLGYWTVPPEAMDSAVRMEPWGRLALEAALRARVGTASGRKKRT